MKVLHLVDWDTSKGSQDEELIRTRSNYITRRQALLACTASEPIKSRKRQMFQRDWLVSRGKAVLKIVHSRHSRQTAGDVDLWVMDF